MREAQKCIHFLELFILIYDFFVTLILQNWQTFLDPVLIKWDSHQFLNLNFYFLVNLDRFLRMTSYFLSSVIFLDISWFAIRIKHNKKVSAVCWHFTNITFLFFSSSWKENWLKFFKARFQLKWNMKDTNNILLFHFVSAIVLHNGHNSCILRHFILFWFKGYLSTLL